MMRGIRIRGAGEISAATAFEISAARWGLGQGNGISAMLTTHLERPEADMISGIDVAILVLIALFAGFVVGWDTAKRGKE